MGREAPGMIQHEPAAEGGGGRRNTDLERGSDLIALAVGSTASFYAHVAFYGGLLALALLGAPRATLLLVVAMIASLEAVFLVIFVQRSANQQAARLEEAIAVIRHNTADHLSEPLDVVVKDIRRELGETAVQVAELARALSRQHDGGSATPPGASRSHVSVVRPPASDDYNRSAGSTVDVLVVDDDVTICELVRDILTETGYSVLMATSGERAMTMLGTYRPRLVLADLDMPAMSGWALCAWLRAHEDLHSVPIILISGSAHLSREAALLGAQGYIAKPFDIDHLLQVISSHLLAA